MEGSVASELAGETTAVTFTTESIPVDLTTLTLDNPSAGRPQVVPSTANSASLLLGGSGSQRYSGRGILNLGQILTDAATHRGIEITFTCDAATAMDWSESISTGSYWGRSFRCGLGFGGDPFTQGTYTSNYNYGNDSEMHLDNSFSGVLFDYTVARWEYFRDVQLSGMGELIPMYINNTTKAETLKICASNLHSTVRPEYRAENPVSDFNGVKTIKRRIFFTDTGRVHIESWVDNELTGVWLSHYRVRESDYLNKDMYLFLGNFVSNATTKVHDITLANFTVNRLVSTNMPAKRRLSTKDFSSSRVKAIKGSDLYRDGVSMATEADYMAIFKQFLTGVGYNGDGGCNWDLIYEDATRLVVRAKTGTRDYFRLTFNDSKLTANTVSLYGVTMTPLEILVESFRSMSDIDTGTELMKPYFANWEYAPTMFFLGSQRREYSRGKRAYVSPEKDEFLPSQDWVLVASDKTFFHIGQCESSSYKTSFACSFWGFGEYESLQAGSDKNSFIYHPERQKVISDSFGPLPQNTFQDRVSWKDMFKSRDNAGFLPRWLNQSGGRQLRSAQESSLTTKSSATGDRVLTPLTLSCEGSSSMPDAWLPQINHLRNAYGGYSGANSGDDFYETKFAFNFADIFDDVPVLGDFNHAGKEYLFCASSMGQPDYGHDEASSLSWVSSAAISLDSEDWV